MDLDKKIYNLGSQLVPISRNCGFCCINKANEILLDAYGHKVADTALIHSAKILISLIRKSDMVSRIGGDEFVELLARVLNIDDTLRTPRQIQNAIEEQQWTKL